MTELNIGKDCIFEPRSSYDHEPDTKHPYDCIVIGTGVAGYSAAMYSARLGLRTLIIGEIPGGTLALTGRIENYPGFVSIEGQLLTELMENHAMDYDVDMLTDIVDKISKKDGNFFLDAGDKTFSATAVILSTGCTLKKLGVEGEEKYFGNGVSYCALCEAAFVKGKDAAVVGGGDSAVKEALILSEHAAKVYIINNEEELHFEEHTKNALSEKISSGEIIVINNNEVTEIVGGKESGHVEQIILKNEFKSINELPVEGVFVYIGLLPNSSLAAGIGASLNENKEIIIDKDCRTDIKGFFAAGDVTNSSWKQAITAVSQGVTAAYNAYRFCRKLD